MTGPNATESQPHKDGNNQGKSHWQTPLIGTDTLTDQYYY